jgi:hypothetical protein
MRWAGRRGATGAPGRSGGARGQSPDTAPSRHAPAPRRSPRPAPPRPRRSPKATTTASHSNNHCPIPARWPPCSRVSTTVRSATSSAPCRSTPVRGGPVRSLRPQRSHDRHRCRRCDRARQRGVRPGGLHAGPVLRPHLRCTLCRGLRGTSGSMRADRGSPGGPCGGHVGHGEPDRSPSGPDPRRHASRAAGARRRPHGRRPHRAGRAPGRPTSHAHVPTPPTRPSTIQRPRSAHVTADSAIMPILGLGILSVPAA